MAEQGEDPLEIAALTVELAAQPGSAALHYARGQALHGAANSSLKGSLQSLQGTPPTCGVADPLDSVCRSEIWESAIGHAIPPGARLPAIRPQDLIG